MEPRRRKTIVVRLEGWHIGFVLCLLMAGMASWCVTKDDSWWIVFAGLTIFGVWDTNRSYKKMMQRREAEKRVKDFLGGD